MTAGLHHRWRERAADRAGLRPGDAALDVCCGTGDLTLELAGRVAPGGHVVGCDFSEPMLDLAREKAAAEAPTGSASSGPTRSAPYDAGRFDAVTVGFGVRNLADLDRGLPEMARVLRPGGRLVDPRDHPADPAAALDLLLALVRPHRPAPRPALRRPGGLRLPAGIGPLLPRPARPRREDALAPASRTSARRSSRAGSSRSTPPSPGDPALRRPAAGDGGPRRLEHAGCRPASARSRSCCARRPPVTASCSTTPPARPWPRAASGCGRCSSCSAPGPTAAPRRSAPPPRSSWSTWRRSSTTTSSTRRRCAAAGRRSSPAAGRELAVATGDLLFSRAFALLAAAGDARAVELLADASVALARGELAQRQDAFDTSIAEQRYLERCRLKTAALFECAGAVLGRD